MLIYDEQMFSGGVLIYDSIDTTIVIFVTPTCEVSTTANDRYRVIDVGGWWYDYFVYRRYKKHENPRTNVNVTYNSQTIQFVKGVEFANESTSRTSIVRNNDRYSIVTSRVRDRNRTSYSQSIVHRNVESTATLRSVGTHLLRASCKNQTVARTRLSDRHEYTALVRTICMASEMVQRIESVVRTRSTPGSIRDRCTWLDRRRTDSGCDTRHRGLFSTYKPSIQPRNISHIRRNTSPVYARSNDFAHLHTVRKAR